MVRFKELEGLSRMKIEFIIVVDTLLLGRLLKDLRNHLGSTSKLVERSIFPAFETRIARHLQPVTDKMRPSGHRTKLINVEDFGI